MAVTMQDVAREAGVSAKTVSNAVNGTGRMSAETRRRVQDAMVRLGYHVNRSAQTLRRGAARMIGLAMPGFGQPFCATYCDNVIAAATRRGYGTAILTYASHADGIEGIIEETHRMDADGWILFSNRPIPDSSPLLAQGCPIVITGDYLSHGRADVVMMPNVEAAAHVTGWLLARGRTVAFAGAPETWCDDQGLRDAAMAAVLQAAESGAAMRLRGYVEEFGRRGLDVDARLVAGSHSMGVDDGIRAVEQLIVRRAGGVALDAIVCANDAVAIGAMTALRRAGLDVPGDVEVTGFDNASAAEYAMPPLTTIDPDIPQYAQLAVDRLIARIDGDESAARTFVTDFRLVERESTR